MYFLLAKKLFFKNIASSVFISILFCISFFSLSLFSENVYESKHLQPYDSTFSEANAFFYMPNDLLCENNEKNIKALESYFYIEDVRIITANDTKSNPYFIFCYGPNTANLIRKTPQVGSWFSTTEGEVVSCVSMGQSNLSKDLELMLENPEGSEIHSKTFHVDGALGSADYIFDFFYASNALSINELFRFYGDKSTGANILLCADSDIYRKATPINENMILFLREEAENPLHEKTNKFVDNAWIVSSKDVIHNYKEARAISYSSYLPLFICFLAVCISGLLSNFCLHYMQNQKTFSVYRICGIRRSGIGVIAVLTNLLFFLLTILITVVLYALLLWSGFVVSFRLPGIYYPCMIFAVALIYAVNALLSYIKIYRNEGKNDSVM